MSINTSQGIKTPAEALALFKKAALPKGDLLGIFKQLEGYPECQESRRHVLDNPTLYNDKICRFAKEMSTGRPIGAKTITSLSGMIHLLRQFGLRASVQITLLKDQPCRINRILEMENLVLSDHDHSGLYCVFISGEWCGVSRTFNATLTLTSEDELNITAGLLVGVVEKIELVSTLMERVKGYVAPAPLSDWAKTLLLSNPDLFYDEELFKKVCTERGFSNPMKRISELSQSSTMEDVMRLFHHPSSREEFLESYIEAFKSALA